MAPAARARRVLAALVTVTTATFAAACAPPPPTALIVRVDSNMAPASELRSFAIAVKRVGEAGTFYQNTFPLDGAGSSLPQTFAVIPANVVDTRSVEVVVTANPGGSPTVTQTARAQVAYTRVGLLDMYLARECVMRECPQDQTCGIDGRCVPVDRGTLPDYPTDGGADASSSDGATDARDTDATTGPLRAPRPLAPLSTSTVTSSQPTLRWELPPGVSGASVELCRNRAMTDGCLSPFAAGGDHAPAPIALQPGAWFWRLRGVAGSQVSGDASATWQFTVGHRGAPIDTSFGSTLDLNGDGTAELAVGADQAGSGDGSVFVYLSSGAAGRSQLTLTLPTHMTLFGTSVASAGDVDGDGFGDLIVGAPGAKTSGAAFVYLGGSGTALDRQVFTLSNMEATAATFGASVAGAGDVNGDGYGDVIVGAPSASGAAGAAYVFLGGPSGVATTPWDTRTGASLTTGFGRVVTGVGDLDGDGFGDVAVGAPNVSQVYVYFGGATALRSGMLTLGDGTEFGYGGALAGGLDVNGDGRPDLVVGASGAGNGGRIHVYLGTAGGISTMPVSTFDGVSQAGQFGAAVASAGDANGDGFADVVVGEPYANSEAGRVTVFFGGASGLTAMWLMNGAAGTQEHFGAAVSGLGDFDGVAGDDFAAAAPGHSGNQGRVLVYAGGTAVEATNIATYYGPAGGSNFGTSLARAGDTTPLGRAPARLAARTSAFAARARPLLPLYALAGWTP